jgi:hypothetical protein
MTSSRIAGWAGSPMRGATSGFKEREREDKWMKMRGRRRLQRNVERPDEKKFKHARPSNWTERQWRIKCKSLSKAFIGNCTTQLRNRNPSPIGISIEWEFYISFSLKRSFEQGLSIIMQLGSGKCFNSGTGELGCHRLHPYSLSVLKHKYIVRRTAKKTGRSTDWIQLW